MNPLYEQMNGQAGQNNFLQKFMQFKQSFKGDPQQQIQQLLNSGRITQEQYNAAVQKAQMLQKMLGI